MGYMFIFILFCNFFYGKYLVVSIEVSMSRREEDGEVRILGKMVYGGRGGKWEIGFWKELRRRGGEGWRRGVEGW